MNFESYHWLFQIARELVVSFVGGVGVGVGFGVVGFGVGLIGVGAGIGVGIVGPL